MYKLIKYFHYILQVPISTLFILNSKKIHPSYKLNFIKKLFLGVRFFINTIFIKTYTSYKTHLVMALKIFETPPETEGFILECGTFKGGCAANLSLVAKMTNRKLLVYDSFEGLPEIIQTDREGKNYNKGDFLGSLDEVQNNISKYGKIDNVEFVKGWFENTLPNLNNKILLAFIDVDLEASLDVCIKNIWPNLIEKGYVFMDEVVGTDYLALFYSERFWKENFNRHPPGLIGAGTGLPLGEYYIGPHNERHDHPLQHPNSGAWTRKDFSGFWNYYPE